MNEKLQIAFGLLGGLAIFIYGMNMMSECLQSLLDIPMHGCTQRNLCQLLRLPEQLP